MSHLLEAGQQGAGNAVEVGRLHDVLNKVLALIQLRLYDDLVVHGVPPGENAERLGFHQETPWTPSRQSDGTFRGGSRGGAGSVGCALGRC
jgi:hypothetical protein